MARSPGSHHKKPCSQGGTFSVNDTISFPAGYRGRWCTANSRRRLPTLSPKKRAQTDISKQQAPSAHIEATPKKPQHTPAQEKATSPPPTPSPTPANDSLDSLMHVPSSLKLNSPAGASPSPANPSPAATPDISLQLAPAPSPSPSLIKGRDQKSRIADCKRSKISTRPFALARQGS